VGYDRDLGLSDFPRAGGTPLSIERRFMTPSSQVKSWDYALAQRAFRPYSKNVFQLVFSLFFKKHRFHNHCTGSRVTPLFYPRFMHTNPSILLHRPNPLGTWKLEALNTIQVFSVDQRNYEEV